MSRPRPVLIVGMITTGLTAFMGVAGLSELIDPVILAWMGVITTVWVATTTFYVQNVVTPLSDPMNNEGQRLRPEH